MIIIILRLRRKKADCGNKHIKSYIVCILYTDVESKKITNERRVARRHGEKYFYYLCLRYGYSIS